MLIEAGDILKALARKHHEDIFVAECNNGPVGSQYRRLDAWVMNRSWARMNYIGYEIKISRSDFLRDKKWVEYLPMCNQLFFVAPRGMIQKSEIPPECGFAELVGSRILTRKLAPKREIEEPVSVLQYILMNRVKISRETNHDRTEYFSNWLREANNSKEIGNAVREKLSKVTRNILYENEKLKIENEQLDEVKQIIKKLGLEARHLYSYQVENRIKAVLSGIPEDTERSLHRLLSSVKDAIERVEELKSRAGAA